MDAGIADSSINAIYQYSGRRMFRHNYEQFNNTAAVEITRQCKYHIVTSLMAPNSSVITQLFTQRGRGRNCKPHYVVAKHPTIFKHWLHCSELVEKRGVFWCNHRLERPASPRRICAVTLSFTLSFQTTTHDLSIFRCSRRCTGCLLNSASTISWPC